LPPLTGIGNYIVQLGAARARDLIKPWIPLKRQLRNLQQQVTFKRGLRGHAIDLYHEPN
jgi:hypothetical protein